MKKFKLTLAAGLVAFSTGALAGIATEGEMGTFNISGDVEFDIDYRDRDDSEYRFYQGGRVLVQFDGYREMGNGYAAEFNAQALFGIDGLGMDDAYLAFGKVDGWNLKVGRFEAYDMFPNGQDTFLEHAGDSNNGEYSANGPYMYHMKEARGRHTDGQIQYSQQFGDLYVELATLLGNRENFFQGVSGAQTNDSLVVRPVIAYNTGNFTIAAALENDLTGEAFINGETVDLSDRIGYGITGNYNNGEGFDANLNLAAMDGYNEDNFSFGANVNLSGFGVGYYYTSNSYQDGNFAGFGEGDITMHSVYSSYEFKDVLGITGFDLYPGAYYSTISDNDTQATLSDDDYGVRIRLKYYF